MHAADTRIPNCEQRVIPLLRLSARFDSIGRSKPASLLDRREARSQRLNNCNGKIADAYFSSGSAEVGY